MKAIQVQQFGGPEVLKLVSLPTLAPTENQILVKVKAVGINPVDTYVRSGTYAVKPELPYTPGFDAAGTIEALGKEIKNFKSGQRVYLSGALSGTYAEFALCDASQVHALPESLTFAQGASLGVPYATAAYALLNRAQIVQGETVLIHGASGAVGNAAIQMAKAHGCRVIATAGTERGVELCKKLGADEVENHAEPGYWEKVLAATQNQGPNVIVEMLANKNLSHDMEFAAKKGRIVVVGNRGTVEINPRFIMGKNASVLGMSLLTISAEEKKEVHASLASGLQNKTLVPIIGQEFPLECAADAHVAVMASGAYGKIVLIC